MVPEPLVISGLLVLILVLIVICLSDFHVIQCQSHGIHCQSHGIESHGIDSEAQTNRYHTKNNIRITQMTIK